MTLAHFRNLIAPGLSAVYGTGVVPPAVEEFVDDWAQREYDAQMLTEAWKELKP